MICSPEERTETQRFDALYIRAQAPVMRSIERIVLGCDYGGDSWTTRAEADQIAALLALRPGLRLLDVGAGSGWPGLYLAGTTGCDVALVDLPPAGLRIAAERAHRDGIPGACWTAIADAAELPFADNSFDAINHSDLLCCLGRKRAALEACRRVIRDHGRMVFTVISVVPGLAPDRHGRAVQNGPKFVESEVGYATLLRQTGWDVVERRDVTLDYAASCRRQLRADADHRGPLQALVGANEFADRQAGWRSKLAALGDGLLRRELFVATPVRA